YTPPYPTQIYTLSLHDALPILAEIASMQQNAVLRLTSNETRCFIINTSTMALQNGDSYGAIDAPGSRIICQRTQRKRVLVNMRLDRKSTRLNSSHLGISYTVFC